MHAIKNRLLITRLAQLTILSVLCALSLPRTHAQQPKTMDTEQILSMHSDITVSPSGEMIVTETIEVVSAGEKIRRGIYRDFPTLYSSFLGTKIAYPFEIIEVQRDGRSEPYHTDTRTNGVRVYIGDANIILTPGTYTYRITYTTNFQIGFFEDHDELYWNATGVGWEFPIQNAVATVYLPHTVQSSDIRHELYTGPQGSRESRGTAQVDPNDPVVTFSTTSPLKAHEGLTVVVGFPKNHVAPPTTDALFQLYFPSLRVLLVGLIGFLIVICYYFWAWIIVGRDPPGSVIIPRFDPPQGFGPACVRYLRQMAYDRTCFTSSLLNLAVHGKLRIIESANDGVFTIEPGAPLGDDPKNRLPKTDRALGKKLLGSRMPVVIKRSNHSKISSAVEALRNALSNEYEGRLFKRNVQWLIPGWILSLLTMVACVLAVGPVAMGIGMFLLLWGSIWSIGCFFLLSVVVKNWKAVFGARPTGMQRISSLISAIGSTAFAAPFLFGLVFAAGVFVSEVGPTPPLILFLLGMIGYGFWHWIKRPSIEGRRILDEIEGFRMYLSTAERDYLAALTPPEKTPELFERYLPYAVALDVENRWAEQFTEVLAAASSPETTPHGQRGYSPSWYSGDHFRPSGTNFATGVFASGLATALGSSIASSSVAPGKSSGFSGGSSGGGGGFSGGGGGGGGGGGW